MGGCWDVLCSYLVKTNKSSGWKTRVLTEDDARAHSNYTELVVKFHKLPTVSAQTHPGSLFLSLFFLLPRSILCVWRAYILASSFREKRVEEKSHTIKRATLLGYRHLCVCGADRL